MFQDAFVKLDQMERENVLADVNPLLQGSVFDPQATTIMAHPLPFYPGYTYVDIADHSAMPLKRCLAVWKPSEAIVLDGTNAPLYALNEKAPISLDDENVGFYARFFFNHVRGRHGRFIIVESVDEIAWKEDPPPAARKAVGQLITPVTILGRDRGGAYKLAARMMFRNSLFKAQIEAQPGGRVSLSEEELLIEDMPVLDDTFGQ